MATLAFGNISTDMRQTDEGNFHGIAATAGFFQFIDNFVPVSTETLEFTEAELTVLETDVFGNRSGFPPTGNPFLDSLILGDSLSAGPAQQTTIYCTAGPATWCGNASRVVFTGAE